MATHLDLVVNGITIANTPIAAFKLPEEMTSWEMDAYDALGFPVCDAENIETLADLAGETFATAFYDHKHRLLAQATLALLRADQAQLEARISKIEARLADPAPIPEIL
jgi:hypothetical protein